MTSAPAPRVDPSPRRDPIGSRKAPDMTHRDNPTAATPRARSGTESSRKVLSLLLTFTEERHTQTVQELAEQVDVPASTAYRYVGQLRELGLLEESEAGGYRVTMRALGLARAARAASAGLTTLARPAVVDLARRTGETALLVKRLGQAAVAVEKEESARRVRMRYDLGTLMSLHRGSAARVLLASMSERERAKYFQTVWNLEENPQLPTEQELATIAEQGWAESFGQIEEGIWGTAAAVREGSDVVAALSVAGPLFRLDEHRRLEIKTAVQEAAAELSSRLSDATID